MKPDIYQCKANDVLLRVIRKETGAVDEIHVKVAGDSGWTVVGYEDLVRAIDSSAGLGGAIPAHSITLPSGEAVDIPQLFVRTRVVGGQYLAYCKSLGLHGIGSTYEEAITSLRSTIELWAQFHAVEGDLVSCLARLSGGQ